MGVVLRGAEDGAQDILGGSPCGASVADEEKSTRLRREASATVPAFLDGLEPGDSENLPILVGPGPLAANHPPSAGLLEWNGVLPGGAAAPRGSLPSANHGLEAV